MSDTILGQVAQNVALTWYLALHAGGTVALLQLRITGLSDTLLMWVGGAGFSKNKKNIYNQVHNNIITCTLYCGGNTN